jgi:uncharacterized integral membrane protein
MRTFLLILKLALFVVVLTFALRNTDAVTVRYFLGWEWQSPLIFVLLIAFCAGIALGVAAGLPRIFRQRREIAALRRQLSNTSHGGTEVTEQGPAQLARS